jgi:hypothetical protein
MMPARHSENPVPTGLPHSGHGRAVAGLRRRSLPEPFGLPVGGVRTRNSIRHGPAPRPAPPGHSRSEGPAAGMIHPGVIQSP